MVFAALPLLLPSLGCFLVRTNEGGYVPPDTAAGTLDTDVSACPADDAPSLELGLGNIHFDAWPSDEVTAFSGAQGGHHLFFAFDVTGLDLSAHAELILETVRKDEVVATQGALLAFTCLESGHGQATGLLVPMDESWKNDDLTFRATVTDPAGTVVTDVATVQVRF